MCGVADCHYFGYMCRNRCSGCKFCRPLKRKEMIMKSVYLIKKIHIDRMENNFNEALYYETVGYVDTEDEAKSLVNLGGTVTGDGYPFTDYLSVDKDGRPNKNHSYPKFQYIKVDRYEM